MVAAIRRVRFRRRQSSCGGRVRATCGRAQMARQALLASDDLYRKRAPLNQRGRAPPLVDFPGDKMRAIVEPATDLVPIGASDLIHRRQICPKPVGDDAARSLVFLRKPLKKLHRRSALTTPPKPRPHDRSPAMYIMTSSWITSGELLKYGNGLLMA
jgi:hypothetical protein